ncbi:hypothetical protein KIN20_032806 [Parelaphostrongylus tenuis]|uniref:Peroxiredoxin-like 2A n=1 Tax=Parelaphostrongylus tenuis TaxID=148309 RepID=A0AAD5R7A1_PARTN|nr:hypothetical protein KIN20_032806 [Parelaphostrongylus tenuis]
MHRQDFLKSIVTGDKRNMAMFGYGALAALGGAILYANLPTRLTIGAVTPTVSYLSEAKLISVGDEAKVYEGKVVQASSLFSKGPTMVMAVRRPGCLLCRKEAAELSSLSPILESAGIQLVAVVHEVKGVNEFKPYFKGDVYFDTEVTTLYGPNQRWLPLWMGFLRIGSYVNIYKAKKAGFHGNTDGEGRLLGEYWLSVSPCDLEDSLAVAFHGVFVVDCRRVLGGVFLIADNKLLYAHLEKEWGDAANVNEIRDFIKSHFA